MKVTAIKMKLFGKVETLFRVLDAAGRVMQVLETREEAEAWMADQ